jgi:hypothetical protein
MLGQMEWALEVVIRFHADEMSLIQADLAEAEEVSLNT